ncbi:hypothetical protein I7I51_05175 [Histoplasma capsulatum]|uniref:Myb-like domain-containing protein n=1 Tax=Ajellomyces capsulatus TaxID=5037 RepID=A0A8A1M850_AJECA|nr:hypothetical protein I7I51_05175 [Histoplasma capsulatum]
MPAYTDGRGGLKLSFADVFKSTKTIREEMAAAAYKPELQKAATAARSKKATADLAARSTTIRGYPVNFRNGSPPSLPPGYPPLVYVPVPSKDANQANGTQSALQYQPVPQTSVDQVQTNPASTGGGSSANNASISPTFQQQQPQPQPQSQQPQQGWTTDDDDTLRRLKAEDMSWKAISTSMGRPVQSLKTRWGIIRPAVEHKIPRPHTSAQGETSLRSQQQQQQTDTNRRHERRVSFSDPLIMAGKVADNYTSTYTRTPHKKKILYVDENFSLEEILLLNRLAAQYDEEKWLRISSRFYDKTGKRLTPQEAKEYVQRG